MQIFLGPFHPHLEEALVAEVQRLKAADPLYPLLLLVPSEQIRRRLQVLLALEQGFSLLAISILTFHQLSKRLCVEGHPADDFSTESGLFFQERLRLVLRQNASADAFLSQVEKTEGGVAALWRSLRDLKDGLVDPDLALAALSEGQFGKGAAQNLRPLFELHRRIETEDRAKSQLSYGDLAAIATPLVPESIFLKTFGRIFYYGFYDLTQVQVDLFQSVARHHDATLFFPLAPKNSGWDYARRFYERHVEGLVGHASQVVDLCTKGPRGHNLFDDGEAEDPHLGPALEIFDCYDARDEVSTAAKEILRLVKDEGLAFQDIGLVAREIETYLPDIKALFKSHALPITTQGEEALIQYPFAKSVLLLLNLRLKDYARGPMIDLLASPDFQAERFCVQGAEVVKDEWETLSRQAGVSKGLSAWEALGHPRDASSTQAALLFDCVSTLAAELEALPPKAAWSDYAARFQALLQHTLGFSPPEGHTLDAIERDALGPAATEEEQEERIHEETLTQDARVQGALAGLFEAISGLDRIAPRIPLETFVETFSRWMARETIPAAGPANAGVSVMGAMAARGLAFSHLFILGMNEGRFPRSIREDPFLPDGHRRVLETVLGYKVGENLAAYDEERLLLTLLVDSTQHRLRVFSHRVDAEGSAASPSWALRRIAQCLAPGQSGSLTHVMPRGLRERYARAPFKDFALLPPEEAALRAAFLGLDPAPVLDTLPLSAALYRQGRAALRRLESGGALTAHDGLIDPSTAAFDRHGVLSPTGLERYALCPFQYFAADLLKLAPVERPEDRLELPASEIGTLCHEILHRFYAGLFRADYFEGDAADDPMRDFNRICAEAFVRFESEHPVAYPLFWEEIKMQIAAFLSEAIAIDLKQLSASGFRPTAFELKCRGKIEADWPEFSGRIDRLDVHPETKTVRAIDYKITFRRQAGSVEKNLLRAALRGERLQPPLYQKLAAPYGEENAPLQSAFYFLAPNWPEGPLVPREFPQDAWAGETGARLKATIGGLLSGMASGHFFIDPGAHCRYCPIAALCRKEHLPSRRRLERDPLWARHRLLRQSDVPSKKKEPGS